MSLGAKNSNKLRYDGLKGCTDYKKAVQLIKDGGYATSPTYVESICNIIERWKLTRYDASAPAEDKPAEVPFLVRVSVSNLNIRKGAGTNYATIGKYTGKGIFTIMEV